MAAVEIAEGMTNGCTEKSAGTGAGTGSKSKKI